MASVMTYFQIPSVRWNCVRSFLVPGNREHEAIVAHLLERGRLENVGVGKRWTMLTKVSSGGGHFIDRLPSGPCFRRKRPATNASASSDCLSSHHSIVAMVAASPGRTAHAKVCRVASGVA